MHGLFTVDLAIFIHPQTENSTVQSLIAAISLISIQKPFSTRVIPYIRVLKISEIRFLHFFVSFIKYELGLTALEFEEYVEN